MRQARAVPVRDEANHFNYPKETGMKKLTQGLTAVAMTLAMSGAVLADDHGSHAKACSNATLEGLYIFSASGFSIVGGMPQPRAVVEFIRFDGAGTISVLGGTVSINGVIIQGIGGPGPAGNYSIAPNCTGTLAFGPPGPTFDLYAAPSGSEVHMIFTGGPVPVVGVVPGVLQGVAERVSR
jgi:hypothetical protein